MTLLFCDSFDHYTSVAAKWPIATGTFQGIGAFGRNGSNGLRCGAVSRPNGQRRNLGANYGTLIAGHAAKPNGIADMGRAWLVLYDAGIPQVSLGMDGATGRIRVWRGDTGAVIGTGASSWPNGVFRYVEVKVVFHPTAGSVTVRVDGNADLTLAGINTAPSGNAYANQVGWREAGPSANGPSADIDDFYLCDTGGAVNNDFLGDVRVQAVLPAGAGTYTEWDGVTGSATHWQAQAQNPPDDDASYVSDSLAVAGHRDTYAMGDVTPTSGTVAGVQVSAWARKDDAGVRTLATMVRSGGADAAGATVSLQTGYAFVTQMFETDPGGAAWTIATVNGSEAGVKAVA
jgi:hypothetical protein